MGADGPGEVGGRRESVVCSFVTVERFCLRMTATAYVLHSGSAYFLEQHFKHVYLRFVWARQRSRYIGNALYT